MKNIIKKTTVKLKNNVLSELKHDPSVKVTDIGNSAKNGTEWWYQKNANEKVLHYL